MYTYPISFQAEQRQNSQESFCLPNVYGSSVYRMKYVDIYLLEEHPPYVNMTFNFRLYKFQKDFYVFFFYAIYLQQYMKKDWKQTINPLRIPIKIERRLRLIQWENRYRPRFFDKVWHQTTDASMGNKHFFTK